MTQLNNAIKFWESLELFWKRHCPNTGIAEMVDFKLGAVSSFITINELASDWSQQKEKQEMERVRLSPKDTIQTLIQPSLNFVDTWVT